MLMTNNGKLIRMSTQAISEISRNTQGVKLIDIEPGERVVGAARLAEEEDVIDIEPGERVIGAARLAEEEDAIDNDEDM